MIYHEVAAGYHGGNKKSYPLKLLQYVLLLPHCMAEYFLQTHS
jgi:hypothetical protein